MDLIGTIRQEYFWQRESFGNDIIYCVYRRIIYPAEYGEYSYPEWVETFYDRKDAIKFVQDKNGQQSLHI